MNLQEKYQKEIIPKLKEELKKKNSQAVPKVVKVVINVGLKDALSDKKIIDIVREDLSLISGQKPVITKARVAIAGFKLRAKDEIGLKVTLRGKRMFDFLEKFLTIVLPRVRDFHGLSINSIDHNGNISIGISEYIVFPEIDASKIEKLRGLEITIVTSARNKDEGKILFELLGVPFQKVKKS